VFDGAYGGLYVSQLINDEETFTDEAAALVAFHEAELRLLRGAQ
jgi:hypothetical protein